MKNPKSTLLLSSEVMISEESKLHPVFLTVRFLLASSEPNRNKEGVTEAFIHDLIARQKMFECLPMYVDMNKLLAGDYDNLTHLYSKLTKKFGTAQFGSLTNFEEETDENGVTYLYAEARFPKRELEACMRLVELYELGKLCVSVELRYNPDYTVEKDGAVLIDANEDNALTGLCIVSRPAEVRAVALDMVASEMPNDSQSIIAEGEEPTNRGETETMENEKLTTEEQENRVAEEQKTEAPEATENQVAEEEVSTVAEDNEDNKEEDPEGSDDEDENKEMSTSEVAQAEVLSHSIDTHESVENWGGDKPVHVVEVRECIVETIEQANALIAQQKEQIAAMENQIAELKQIEEKYNAIVAEEQKRILAEKQAQTKAFAEKQGLDVNAVAVAEAIEKLDYEKIMELTMAEQKAEEEKEPVKQTVAIAGFAEVEVGNSDKYGGLLSRRNK